MYFYKCHYNECYEIFDWFIGGYYPTYLFYIIKVCYIVCTLNYLTLMCVIILDDSVFLQRKFFGLYFHMYDLLN